MASTPVDIRRNRKISNEAFKEIGSGSINMAKVIEAAQSIGVGNRCGQPMSATVA